MKKKIDIVDVIIGVFVGAVILIMCLFTIMVIDSKLPTQLETSYEICEIVDAEHTKAVEHRRGIPGKTAGRTYETEEFNIYIEFADGNVHYFTVNQDTYAKAKANSKVNVKKVIGKTKIFKADYADYEIIEFLK